MADVTIAHHPAKAVEVSLTGVNYESCPTGRCLPLFQREPAPPENTTSAVIRFQGHRLRFEVVDLKVAKLVLMYSAPEGEFQDFLKEAKSTFTLEAVGEIDQITATSITGPQSARRTVGATLTAEVKGECVSSRAGTLVSFYEGEVRDERKYGSAAITPEGRATLTTPNPLKASADRPDVAVVLARYEGDADCGSSTSPPRFVQLV